MESSFSENTASRVLRRSTRQSTAKALSYEPTPRGPIKRFRETSKKPAVAVNGSREEDEGAEDEDSPTKKIRLEGEEEAGEELGGGDNNGHNEMEVQESDEGLKNNQDLEMDIDQDSSTGIHLPKICQENNMATPMCALSASSGTLGDVNSHPCVMSSGRCRLPPVKEGVRVKSATEGASTESVTQIKPPQTRHDLLKSSKKTYMEQYKRTLEAKAYSDGITAGNHLARHTHAVPEKSIITQRLNNIPTQKETIRMKKQGGKKVIDKGSSARSSRGFMWNSCFLVLLMLLSFSAFVLVYKFFPVLRRTLNHKEHLSKVVESEKFADHLNVLQTQFPSQRSDLWKRSKIHLENHLRTAQPTQPVSLIFTAGLRAKRTLYCLAQGLAASFASAHNGSVLHIDGASKAGGDSDEVKLYIDTQLQEAFQGDKPVAVIHRLEELPPGSTLIFYRYCDHENAAYKRAFLLFTVLLPQDEVKSEQSLKEVEEMVQDYVKEKLVGSGDQTDFNEMDTDKYSGLWSRISHLILPVVSEKDIEQKGC